MTQSPSEVKLLPKTYRMFIEWGVSKNSLFLPKYADTGEERYDFVSKMYVLMKRLHQSYTDIMTMDSDTLDKLFKAELSVIEKENSSANGNKSDIGSG